MEKYYEGFMDDPWGSFGGFFSDFEAPLKDFFGYKPSHYKYFEEEKP